MHNIKKQEVLNSRKMKDKLSDKVDFNSLYFFNTIQLKTQIGSEQIRKISKKEKK